MGRSLAQVPDDDPLRAYALRGLGDSHAGGKGHVDSIDHGQALTLNRPSPGVLLHVFGPAPGVASGMC